MLTPTNEIVPAIHEQDGIVHFEAVWLADFLGIPQKHKRPAYNLSDVSEDDLNKMIGAFDHMIAQIEALQGDGSKTETATGTC